MENNKQKKDDSPKIQDLTLEELYAGLGLVVRGNADNNKARMHNLQEVYDAIESAEAESVIEAEDVVEEEVEIEAEEVIAEDTRTITIEKDGCTATVETNINDDCIIDVWEETDAEFGRRVRFHIKVEEFRAKQEKMQGKKQKEPKLQKLIQKIIKRLGE